MVMRYDVRSERNKLCPYPLGGVVCRGPFNADYLLVIMCENIGLTIQAKQAITGLSYVGFTRPFQTCT
jgi:hypothetical protein